MGKSPLSLTHTLPETPHVRRPRIRPHPSRRAPRGARRRDPLRPRRPPGLPGRPARGDGAGARRVHRRGGQRDRVVPRADQRPAGRLAGQLTRYQHEPARRPAAEDRQLDLAVDHVGREQALEVVDAEHRIVADGDDEILRPDAGAFGRRAGDHLDDLDAARAADRGRNRRRQRPGAAGDPDPRSADAPVAHQRRHDLRRRRVDRHGEAEADARDRRVDPDDAAAPVDERAARVARVQRGVGLDHVVDHAHGAAGARRQRAAERGDDARGDRALEPVRVADRDHELADAQLGGVAERRRLERGLVGAQHGEVREGVRADEPERELAPVGERATDAAAPAADDVRGRQQEAVGRDHDAGAAARASSPAPDPEVRDRRGDRLGDERDDARVRVERLGLVGKHHRSHLLDDSDSPARRMSARAATASTRRHASRRVCFTCMRADNSCIPATTCRPARSALGVREPHGVAGHAPGAGRGRALLHAAQGAVPARRARRAVGQGRGRAARDVAGGDVALGRRPRPARPCRPQRVGERSPLAAGYPAPPGSRGSRPRRRGPRRRAGRVRRPALRRRAQRPARGTPPHRRKDLLPMTERLRLSEHNRRWWTLGAMSFALFMVMLDNTAVNVALPSIQKDFGASLSALEWTVNAYTLTFAVLLVTGGRLGDIFGRRRMFLFGVVVFSLASATIGFAPSEGWLVASRAVQGIGAAFMMPGTLSIISNAFPPEERGKAIGTWAGVSAIALAAGPLLGGWLTEEVSWRAIFVLNPGIAGITVALAALVFALVEGNQWGWGSPGIIGLLALSVVAFAAFVAVEKRAAAPVVDFDALRSKQFLGANVVAFMVSFGMLAMFFFLALYMQNILGYSPLEAGVRFLPSTVVIIFAGPIAGRLADRFGPRPLMVTGMLITATSLLWQSRIDVDTSYAFLAPAFVLMGLGMGLVMSPMSMAAMNAVDRTKAGVASGTLSMFRMVGGTFGVAALGALVAAIGRHDLERSLPQVPAPARDQLVDGLGSGAGIEGAPSQVVAATQSAFVDALGTGLTISAIAVAAAAVAAWFLISPGRPAAAAPPPPAEPAAEAELATI